MVGWHHRLDRHEPVQTPRDSEGQGSLACCSPRGLKESGHDLEAEQRENFSKEVPANLTESPHASRKHSEGQALVWPTAAELAFLFIQLRLRQRDASGDGDQGSRCFTHRFVSA